MSLFANRRFPTQKKTVGRDSMNNCKEERYVASANEKKAIKKDDDWREICKDCEILSRFSDCVFGCEFIMDSQKMKSKK
jgi:hypothetical protein